MPAVMTEHQNVYRTEAERYEALVSREDYQGNILREIQRVTLLKDMDVVELGAGTGRITCLLAPLVRSITAFDASAAMLDVARRKLVDQPSRNWRLLAADNRRIPLPYHCADLVISGWSICYLADWGGADWQVQLFISLAEMKRLLRPGGTIILL